MEETTITTEPQERQTTAELRSWVTPAFEKFALNEALFGLQYGVDGTGYS